MRSDVDAGEQQAAYVFLTLMAVCFGGTWLAGKVAVDAISPFTLAATARRDRVGTALGMGTQQAGRRPSRRSC